MQKYTIRPINTGFVCNSPKQYHFHPSTHKFHPELSDGCELYPVFCFLLQGEGKNILVDTGMCDGERAGKYHHPGSRQEPGQKIYEQLEKLNIPCEDIDGIILTHLHWDHCYYLDRFVNARIIVSKKELEFAENPIPLYYKSYEYPVLGIKSPFADLALETCEGETEVFPGVTVFETPGHSPGHISVEVETNNGKYIIGGDSAFRLANFQEIPEIHYTVTPPGRFYNIVESWKSLELIKKRAESLDKILLTHESGLLDIIKKEPVIG